MATGRQKRVEDDAQLLAHIETVHDDSKGRYGSPRVYRELRATGVRCSRHRVARLMRAAGRRGRGKRRSKSTTDSGHALPVAENLLMRQFEVAEPNLVWAADMTFIRTTEGWLYLAVVLDLYSRKIVGWSMGSRMTADLPLAALRMAFNQRHPTPGLMHHSDRGSQGGFKWSSQHLKKEVVMSTGKRKSERAGRRKMRSPGRPQAGRSEHRRRFWKAIAAGLTSEAAGIDAGVSPAVGSRWFREAGGMPSTTLAPWSEAPSGRYLSFTEREEIALCRAQSVGIREIARRLSRSPSTISREVRRNAATRSGGLEYRATTAQWHADRSACRPKLAKLRVNEPLRTYVQDRLAGQVVMASGESIPGPVVPFNGRRHGRRQRRRWASAWSPQQIAQRLPLDFPDDRTMRISHEAIYQALYIEDRGGLHRELTACLRTGRTLRVPRARRARQNRPFVAPEVMLDKRPAEVADRAVPGHWEGDLILGLGSSAIGTLVERSTRFTLLLHLPRLPNHGVEARVKNGPALAGHGAEAVREAITRAVATLPDHLRRSLTWDQGAEMSQHVRLRQEARVDVYFCEPRSPWQRGTNENTNGLLRQYFPKGTDLSLHGVDDLAAVAATLNARPRKVLGWRTPNEVFEQLLHVVHAAVATTT